jgi:hypothetical protein
MVDQASRQAQRPERLVSRSAVTSSTALRSRDGVSRCG